MRLQLGRVLLALQRKRELKKKQLNKREKRALLLKETFGRIKTKRVNVLHGKRRHNERIPSYFPPLSLSHTYTNI